MEKENMSDNPVTGEEKAVESNDSSRGILLIPYPKFVFFYPTAITACIASIWLLILNHESLSSQDTVPVAIASVFLAVLSLNLVVIVFDFPRTTSLLLLFGLATIALAIWLVFLFNPSFMPVVGRAIHSIRPVANSTFYGCIAVVMAIMYVLVYFSARFNYWNFVQTS